MTKTTSPPDDDGRNDPAQRHRERMAKRMREQSASAAEIGPIDPPANPYRRETARYNLHHFLVTYFPSSTGLKPFSEDHLRVINRVQKCALEGGRFVEAIYRGFAKSTILENSILWIMLYGHRQFPVLFAASKELAKDAIESIKSELEDNDLLAEDFPEVCVPVQALEGKVQRCASQTQNGRKTDIHWTADAICLPTVYVPEGWGIPDAELDWENTQPSEASGVVMKVKPYGARGLRHKRADGKQVRPDFVGIDDPQKDEGAGSPLQVSKKLKTLKKAILRLGGHMGSMAVVIAATIIERDDMIDQLINPKLNPSWQGERIRMMKSFADHHEDEWLGRYAEIRNDYDPDDIEDQRRARRDSTEYYRANREKMDKGCEVSWEHCYSPEDLEISAIQHAYNILIDDGYEAFMSECQNEPIEQDEAPADALKPADIEAKTNGYERYQVPIFAEHVTAHIDVQQDALYWTVAGWGDGFAGGIMDYGAFPSQGSDYFGYSEITRTLRWAAGRAGVKAGIEGALWWGLDQLTRQLFGREYERDDGTIAALDLCLIDAGYKAKVVREFIRQSDYRDRLMPAIGRGIGAKDKPMIEWPKKRGERRGLGWTVPPANAGNIRHVLTDVNEWKSAVAERLKTPIGDPGCLAIYGRGNLTHRMLAEHLTAEYPVLTEGRGRAVEEWTLRTNRDNHLLDTVVGSAVAASMVGVRLVRNETGDRLRNRRKRRVSFAELQRRARQPA